jgi:hypothetical protein
MKVLHFILMLIVSASILSCKDDNITDIGSGIMPATDKIEVAAESFNISSGDFIVPSMFVRQDSFLLGTFYDETYGTTHADILAQVESPENHSFNPGMVPDSVLYVMYYNQYFGDKYSPMHVNIYEMNKATFRYTQPYPTNLNPFDYSDKSLFLGKKTFTAVDATKRNDSTFVSIKLSDDFVTRFSTILKTPYNDLNPFTNAFKGVYVVPDFGSAVMLYVRRLDLEYYYHYFYTTKDSQGKDSVVKVNSMVTFPANARVRQVNRFLHPDTTAIKNKLTANPGQIHHISSPANVYTRINLPLLQMQTNMENGGKRLAINNAKLRVDVAEINTDALSQNLVRNVLLIRENDYNNFFIRRKLPDNTTAILGTLSNERNTTSGEIDYFYSFDIAQMLATEFKNARSSGTALTNNNSFVLIPVRLRYDSNNNITEVDQQYLLSAVSVCGGNHPVKPMKVNVVYTRF